MAEESDLERTEPASQRRLEQARERGQVPRSPELSTFAVLLAAGGGMIMMGGALVDSLERIMRAGLTLDRASAFDTARLTAHLYEGAAAALVGFAPLFLLVILAPLLVSVVVRAFGWSLLLGPNGIVNPTSDAACGLMLKPNSAISFAGRKAHQSYTAVLEPGTPDTYLHFETDYAA